VTQNKQNPERPDPADEVEDVNALMQFPEDPAVTAHRMYPVSAADARAAESDPMAGAMDAIAALAKKMDDPRLKGWPKMADFPQTEDGFGEYLDAWAARRRRAATLSSIPMEAVEAHREAIALGREKDWNPPG